VHVHSGSSFLFIPFVLGQFIIAEMAVPEIRSVNLQDVGQNPTMPAPSLGEWRDFLSKCRSDVDVLAARWHVDPTALRAVCEDGARMDGMSNFHMETICSPSFSAAEAPSHNEGRLLHWIYCEMEPWLLESEFLMFSRPHLEDVSKCLSVKVWSPQVHLTAAKHCANTIKNEGLSLALKKFENAVASGEV
jgi:hypothetical protein